MRRVVRIVGIIDIIFIFMIFGCLIFKGKIIRLLVKQNNLVLAKSIYIEKDVMEEVAITNYIGVDSKVDRVSFLGEVSKSSTVVDEYEEEILVKDKGNSDYKVINVNINGYKGYLVAIYDPAKVKLVTSKGFNQGNTGQQTVIDICNRYGGLVCINGGGFVDYGTGSDIPLGYVIEDGKIKWKVNKKSYLIGFNNDNEMVLMYATGEEAVSQGVRDALEFGPFLIDKGKILVNENTLVGGFKGAARVAIAQRRDGIVLFLVTEGRHAKGPTVIDVASLLAKYGAYMAANLDGGASSSLVIKGKLINNPLNIYGQPVNYGRGRGVVTGFGLVK